VKTGTATGAASVFADATVCDGRSADGCVKVTKTDFVKAIILGAIPTVMTVT
jgi:hypothetical protein